MRLVNRSHAVVLGVLVLLATLGVAGCGRSNAQGAAVGVTLYDTRITSSQAALVPGKQYHFTVVNKGYVNHEMMMMPSVMGNQMAAMPMDNLDRVALARTGDLAPNGTKSFDYIVPTTMAGHQIELGCFYPGHYESGMHLALGVGK